MSRIRQFKSIKATGIVCAILIGLSLTAATAVATVKANPVTWTKAGNPVLTTSGWDAPQVWVPRVLYDGNLFRMWYLGGPDGQSKVGYATSSDGTHWIKNPNPVLQPGPSGAWDSYRITPGHVFWNGTYYLMWYRGRASQGDPGAFGLAVSSDGVSWTKYPRNPIMTPSSADVRYFQYPYVIKVGSTFMMWFTELVGSGKLSIYYAASQDGIRWSQRGSPVLTPSPTGWDSSSAYSPTVIYNAGSYQIFYSGSDGSVARIGYATSTDGVTWAKSADSPIVGQGPSTGWDNGDVDNQDAVAFQNTIMLYYSGARFEGGTYSGYSIGLAQLSPAATTTTPSKAPGPCLIATATYGSELAPEVQLLRNFRDNSILKTAAGSNFMIAFNAWYYSFSPYVANYISTHWVERTIMKGVLYPLIGILALASATFSATGSNAELGALLSGLLASSLIGAFYVGLPFGILRTKVRRLHKMRAQRYLERIFVVLVLSCMSAFLVGEIFSSTVLLMITASTIVLSTLLLSATLTSSRIANRLRVS